MLVTLKKKNRINIQNFFQKQLRNTITLSEVIVFKQQCALLHGYFSIIISDFLHDMGANGLLILENSMFLNIYLYM